MLTENKVRNIIDQHISTDIKVNENLFIYPEGKTNYQITNEYGKKTTITIEKWVADILQRELVSVHLRIQIAYNKIFQLKPELGRRLRDGHIRLMAETAANKYQKTKKRLLGWNDDEMLNLL